MAADTIPGELTTACAAVRPAGPGDEVAGVLPRYVAAPASTQEVSGLLRAASGLGLAVVPRGTGTRLHWGYPPSRCDLVLELTAMDRVVEHAAGDLVVTVQAGLALDRLAEVLRAAGQRLALDPPPGAGSRGRGTVGGVLATGVAGPLRLRYGSGRDLLIGVTIVRADGTVARAGGKVVKNVAGYDLGKLVAGSRGTLAVITEATFRLHPLPAATAAVSAQCPAAVDACRLISAALDSPLAPVSAELSWPSAGEPVSITIGLEGDHAGVADRAAALASLLTASGGRSVRDATGTAAVWPATDGTVAQVAFWPGDLGMVVAEIRAAADAVGLDPAISGSAGAGILYVSLPEGADPGTVATFVTGLRSALGRGLSGSAPRHRLADVAQAGAVAGHPRPTDRTGTPPPHPATPRSGPPGRASVVVLHAPPSVTAVIDLFGSVSSLALMRAVKRQFDPDGILSPGRFAGGL